MFGVPVFFVAVLWLDIVVVFGVVICFSRVILLCVLCSWLVPGGLLIASCSVLDMIGLVVLFDVALCV